MLLDVVKVCSECLTCIHKIPNKEIGVLEMRMPGVYIVT